MRYLTSAQFISISKLLDQDAAKQKFVISRASVYSGSIALSRVGK